MRSWAERSFSSQYLQLFLTVVVALNIVPFVGEVPIWILAFSSSFITWSALYVFRIVRLPNKFVRWSLAVACMAGVFIQFKSIVGQEPATAFLILLAALKLLETVRYRDAMYVTFVSYFLLMDYVLISQTLAATIYMVFSIGAITTLLFYLHGDRGKLSLRSLKTVLRTLWLAVPIWVFLFIIFPRFSAALWTINSDTKAKSGFSDELNPGDIAQLVESDELAFRATFISGPQPRYEEMYWRGGILWYSDGLKWTKKNVPPTVSSYANKQDQTVQEIVLEPGYSKFIFGLDKPLAIRAVGNSPFSVVSKTGSVFERLSDASIRTLYNVNSAIRLQDEELSTKERLVYLQTPRVSSEIQNLVANLKGSSAQSSLSQTSEEKLSEAVIDYFLKNKFRYTKAPGSMKDLDDFIFNKKIGFCEHFAGTYATLMRLLGVPSRVVIGFQGGIKNKFADHWIIRSLDAHAWDEIFIQGQGWTRVDPTSFIAPMRITLGGDYNNIDLASLPANFTRDQLDIRINATAVNRWFNNTSLAFDLISSRWNNFLLRYDFEYQSSILSSLGVRSGQRALLITSLIVGIAILLLFTRYWMRRAKKRFDPLVDAYRDFCNDIRLLGVARLPSEGPLQYSGRLGRSWPDRAEDLNSLLKDYSNYRYGRADTSREQVRAWRKRAFQLARSLKKIT